ncbi:MAG: site-2 protease family protein [Cellulosilyticaceae bacterium]
MLDVNELIYTLPAILIAITCHELAHGYMSYRLGDPTAKSQGRLTLNPFAHLDLVGTVCLILFHFGWAKPVPVNPNYYKDRKGGMVLVSLAGPVTNFVLALVSLFGAGMIIKVTNGYAGDVAYYFYQLFTYSGLINLGLGVFNLIPFPPLDGSKIIGAAMPEDKYFKYLQFERYGYFILLGLLWLGLLDKPLGFINGSLYHTMWFIVNSVLGLGM